MTVVATTIHLLKSKTVLFIVLLIPIHTYTYKSHHVLNICMSMYWYAITLRNECRRCQDMATGGCFIFYVSYSCLSVSVRVVCRRRSPAL